MAIELAPKIEERKFLVLNILFYFTLALILVTIFNYFMFLHFERKNSKNIENLDSQIISMKTQERKEAEQKLLNYQKKIDTFSQLLKNHKYLLTFFDYIEDISHPRVYFREFSLEMKESKVMLSGVADSFQALGQQILMFKKADFIENVNLSGIVIGEEGGAEFSIDFSLLPDILKYREPKSEPILPPETKEEIGTGEEVKI